MYCGYVVRLKDGKLHPNANKLKIWRVFDTDVITDLNYNDGDICIYFPSDGQLSEEFCADTNLVKKYKPVSECTQEEIGNKQVINKNGIDCVNVGGYMEPDKRNIKAIRLRGEKSDGLLLPISCLKKYTNKQFNVGDQIDTIDRHEICRKYIPKRHRQQSDPNKVGTKRRNRKELKEKVSWDTFMEHKDTAQLAYNQGAFHEGDLIYLTRKVHGTSARSANLIKKTKHKNGFFGRLFHLREKIDREYDYISGTRRTTLRFYDGGYYGNNAFRKPYHDFFVGKLPKGMEVFYEICGWVDDTTPIMPSVSNSKIKDKEFKKQYGKETVFTYGCEPGTSRMFVYRITMTNEDGVVFELPTEQCLVWCEKWGCEFVPVLEKFFYTTWEDLNQRVNKWLDIPEPLADGKHIVEGVVARIDSKSSFTAYKAKSYNFKILEGLIKEEADAPDMEEAEELIAESNQSEDEHVNN